MKEWLIHPKVFDHSTQTITKKKFKKIESENLSVNQEKQFFENTNPKSDVLSIEVNKIDDHLLLNVNKKPILHFFHKTNPSPRLRHSYGTSLKLQCQNENTINKLNSLLKDFRLKFYVANRKRDDLEVTFSGGLEYALIVLSVINKEFQNSRFSPEMQQALVDLLFKDPNGKEALLIKQCLNNFSKFNPDDLDEKTNMNSMERTRLYWAKS